VADELFGKCETVKDKVPYRKYEKKPVAHRVWVPVEEIADAVVALRAGSLDEYTRVTTWLTTTTRRVSQEAGPEDGKRGDVEIINHRIVTHWLTGRPAATMAELVKLPRLRTGPLAWAEYNFVILPFVTNKNDQERIPEESVASLLNRADGDAYVDAAVRDAEAGIPPVPTGALVPTTNRMATVVKALLAMGYPPYPPTRIVRDYTELVRLLDGGV